MGPTPISAKKVLIGPGSSSNAGRTNNYPNIATPAMDGKARNASVIRMMIEYITIVMSKLVSGIAIRRSRRYWRVSDIDYTVYGFQLLYKQMN
jgi:hypothetical protein